MSFDGESPLVKIVSKYEFGGKNLRYTTCFYKDVFTVSYKDRSVGEVPYGSMLRVARDADCLRFDMGDGSCIKVACTDDEKKSIFRMFKIRKQNLMRSSCEKNVVGLVLVEFANLRFFVCLSSASFADFKMKAIRRIGAHFFPSQKMDYVSLDNYNEFSFYARNGDLLVSVENDDDLMCALLYFKKKLNILIEHVCKE